MKTIEKNKENVIECECGTIIEFENKDCSLAFSDKRKDCCKLL
jgi:hypothetical protein